MALFINEYASIGSDRFSYGVAAPAEPAVAAHSMAVTGASTASNVFHETTGFVMIHAQEATCLAFGTAPVAVTTAGRIGAGETRFYSVPAGKNFRVAGIAST